MDPAVSLTPTTPPVAASLSFIEDFIRDQVLPRYANTHTESSGTGRQTTRLREDARRTIRDAIDGDDDTCVIFCGSGATGAIDKLIGILGLRTPIRARGPLSPLVAHPRQTSGPVVFIGPFEHHSNELPWRESIADVVTINEDADGHIDQARLTTELETYADRPMQDRLLLRRQQRHRHRQRHVRHLASAPPPRRALVLGLRRAPARTSTSTWRAECRRRHSPTRTPSSSRPHKFVGGPGTPGVLAVRRELLTNRVPVVVGGGTVAYVNPERTPLPRRPGASRGGRHAGDRRVDPGRAGLPAEGGRRRRRHPGTRGVDYVQPRHRGVALNPSIEVLGNLEAERLSILSFVVRRPGGRYLHHNSVVALLNDLFGIQARGGCSCAGPYGHRLLGIDIERSHEFEREITAGCEGIKPGWVRVNFNYFIDEAVFEYIVRAVAFVAQHGHAFLGLLVRR